MKLKCTENAKSTNKKALKSETKRKVAALKKHPTKYQNNNASHFKNKERCYRDPESRRQYLKKKCEENSAQQKEYLENPEPKKEYEQKKYQENAEQKRE